MAYARLYHLIGLEYWFCSWGKVLLELYLNHQTRFMNY
ncbi:hypothetical protein ACQJBY_057773 [Aegilops geniculata]